jgi:hypothetical protein
MVSASASAKVGPREVTIRARDKLELRNEDKTQLHFSPLKGVSQALELTFALTLGLEATNHES